MFTGAEIASTFARLGVSHVVWLPDSVLGGWEQALANSSELKLLRVCREGEAWALAAGLYLGGCQPLVVIQNTGLFESGDALRNVLFDMQLPLYAVVGYRSFLVENSADTARRFTEPVLRAWDLDSVLIDRPDKLSMLSEHYLTCRNAKRPGVALLAEGRG